MEEKVNGEASSEEGAESPKRKVIRVESEENAKLCERSFEFEQGRSKKNKFRAKRDQHPHKGPSFSVTINAASSAFNESLTAKGLAPLKNRQWKAVVEKKARRGRLGICWERTIEYFSIGRLKVKKVSKRC